MTNKPPRRLVMIVCNMCHVCGEFSNTVKQQHFLGDFKAGWSFCEKCKDKVKEINEFWENVYKNMSVGAFGYSLEDEIKIERADGSINIGAVSGYELILSRSSNTFKICVEFMIDTECMTKAISFSQFLTHNPPKQKPNKEIMIQSFKEYAKINTFTGDAVEIYKTTLEDISSYF